MVIFNHIDQPRRQICNNIFEDNILVSKGAIVKSKQFETDSTQKSYRFVHQGF